MIRSRGIIATHFNRNIFLITVSISILVIKMTAVLAQCEDTADFRSWFEPQQSGNWLIVSPREVVEAEELFPPAPSFFVSGSEFMDVRFSFDVASVNSSDDDFIGFVMGYQAPLTAGSSNYQFVLLDWKASAETAFSSSAQEGFVLARYQGTIAPGQIPNYFWGHNGVYPNSVISPLAYSFGDSKGWESGRSYHFEVLYSASSIQINIDGNRLFDVPNCNQAGRIGFYTYSQHDVIFSNFTWRSAADAFVKPLKICSDDTVFFSLESDSCGGFNPLIQTWQWNFGDGESIPDVITGHHIFNDPGNYALELIATFPGNCKDTVINLIQVQPPLQVDLGPDTTLPAHSAITIIAGPDQGAYDYVWTNGSVLNHLELTDIEKDTTVGVSVTFGNCHAYDEISIHIETKPLQSMDIYIPNAFTPDGDGLNDYFIPEFKEEIPASFSMCIFNNWGQQVFETSDPITGWDGKCNGKQCPLSVYVYIIKYSGEYDGQTVEMPVKKGNVLLLR